MDRSARRTVPKRIPGFGPGVLFLSVALALAGPGAESSSAASGAAEGQVGRSDEARSGALRLAEALVKDEDWAAARVEARRAERKARAEELGAEVAAARLVQGLAALRMGESEAAGAILDELWKGDSSAFVPQEVRCVAAYERGRDLWAAEKGSEAGAAALAAAFRETRNPELFWRAGASLYFLFEEAPKLRERESALAAQVELAREAWPDSVWRRSNPRTSGLRKKEGLGGVFALPGRALVAFYRAQIGPALGGRCALQPSCSEYFLQASRKHGLAGVPMITDRFVREPTVTGAREVMVELPDGAWRIADPVEWHDFWWCEDKE